MREKELYPKISELFQDSHHVFTQYRIPDNSWREIDVLCVRKRKRELIAIEAKVRDWKKAVNQAFTRLFYVDESYIAIPHEHIPKVDRKILRTDGIGLISINSNAEILIEPTKSRITLDWRKEMLLDDIKGKII